MQYVLKRYPQRDGVNIHLVDMFFINNVAWNWESAYNQRMDIRNCGEGVNTNTNSRGSGGSDGVDEKCKCCLCNTINIQCMVIQHVIHHPIMP